MLDESQTLPIAMTRRRGVEHDATAERRRSTQDHAVGTGRNDGCGEPQLRPALSHANETGCDARGAEMSLHTGAVRDRLELVERDVEPVGDRVRPGRNEGVPAPHRAPFDTRKAHGDALPRFGAGDVAIVHLHTSDSNESAGWLDAQLVTVADRARPERAGDHGPDPPKRE